LHRNLFGMTYQETIDYLYTQLPMFTRVGASAYKADLHNTIALCEALDNPQHKFKSIHIAGTNGKGSSSHALASILQEAGYTTGLYTSPHVYDFRERIRINGEKVTEEFVVEFVEKIKPISERISPSFFEITVAMAFEYFAQQKVDIAVIEVGLGGLLDSTNVILPEVSLITNIGYDHMNLLGNTLQEIATQKAGIIKKHVPVVISETQPEIEQLFRMKARENDTAIVFADVVYDIVKTESNSPLLQRLKVVNKTALSIHTYDLDILGKYQTKNCKGVLATVHVLNNLGWKIEEEAIQKGLLHIKQNTQLIGRFDILQHRPTIIADVAHNAEGIAEVLDQVNAMPHQQLHIIAGFVADKDVQKVMQFYPKNAQYYFTQANIPRAMPATQVQEIAEQYQLQGNAYSNSNEALKAAKKASTAEDIILVCGSFFILAEIDFSIQ
jgi:dihydrofolate synthase / folylpolyglutamate synthase